MIHRRARGTGTICLRKDGRYGGQVYVLTIGGGRRRISVYGKTWQEAEQKLTIVKAQSMQGIPSPDHAWRMSEFLDYWLKHGVSIKRRPMTYKHHEMIVRLYIKPDLGGQYLQHLGVRKLQEYFDELYYRKYTISMIHHVRKVLSAALTYAMRQELVHRNVARLVELPPYHSREAQHWTVDELAQFLKAAEDDPLYPAFVLLVLYGLRRGEVLGLRWCDVDFELGVLSIRQQLQRFDGTLHQVPLKTNTSRRDEPLLGTARELMQTQRAKQETLRQVMGADWQGPGGDDELIFTTRYGRPIEPRNLYRSLSRIRDEQGMRHVTVHGLRHSNATIQKNLNVHSRDIAAILGHGDVKVTGIYEHVELGSKREALEKVEGVFFRDTLSAVRKPGAYGDSEISLR